MSDYQYRSFSEYVHQLIIADLASGDADHLRKPIEPTPQESVDEIKGQVGKAFKKINGTKKKTGRPKEGEHKNAED